MQDIAALKQFCTDCRSPGHMVIYTPVLCYGVKMAFKKAGNGSTVANIILNLAAQIGL